MVIRRKAPLIPKKSSGFSLVELIVSVTILSILSTVGYTIYNTSQISARDVKRKQDLKAIAASLEVFHQYRHVYPTATVNSSAAGWTGLLSNQYIIVMPIDPQNSGTHVYSYIGTGPAYDLCAFLENIQEPVSGNIVAGGTPPCGGSAAERFFHIAGP